MHVTVSRSDMNRGTCIPGVSHNLVTLQDAATDASTYPTPQLRHRSQLSEALSERDEFTLSTFPREAYESVTRFIWGDYISLSYTWGGL